MRYINGESINQIDLKVIFDFVSESDQSNEESKSKHSQSSEDKVETFKHKKLKLDEEWKVEKRFLKIDST